MGILDATSNVAQGLAQIAARASEVLPNAGPNSTLEIDPAEKGRTVTQSLLDLRVPQTLRDWLTPPLESLGFAFDTVQVQGSFGSPSRSYDVVRNAAGLRSMFHLPKEILTDGSSWEAVGNIISVLRLRDQILLILSEGLQTAHVAYAVVGEPLWQSDFRVTATFLPWSFLAEIQPMPQNDQQVFLPKILKLEDLLTAARALPVSQITDAEIVALADILSKLKSVIDNGEKGWRLILEQAGLRDLTGSFELGGAPNDVAFSLLSRLKRYAPLPTQPQDQILGLLLCQVIKIPDLEVAQNTQVKTIIEKYNLAPSAYTKI